MSHCGVTVDDPRNAGIIEYFRPKAVTTDLIVRILAKAVAEGTSSSVLKSSAVKAMQAVMRGPVHPGPRLSQSLDEVADPWFGLVALAGASTTWSTSSF
jgi:hypothetical protein